MIFQGKNWKVVNWMKNDFFIYSFFEVIFLKAMTAMDYQMQAIENRAIEKGIVEGEFSMALKIKEKYGIEKAIEISGFSREELESEKLI